MSETIKIGSTEVGSGNPVYIVGEIGINHNGDLKIAKQLIDIAVESGLNAVKFQKRTPELCVPKDQWDIERDTPWGRMRYIDYRHKVEFTESEYQEISDYCELKNITWFASPWDIDSQSFIHQYDLKYNKIASAMLTNTELLKTVAQEKKYTFISTGMSSIEEIGDAVNIFRECNCPFELMHANSSYPMKIEEANLLCIPMLKKKFNCEKKS